MEHRHGYLGYGIHKHHKLSALPFKSTLDTCLPGLTSISMQHPSLEAHNLVPDLPPRLPLVFLLSSRFGRFLFGYVILITFQGTFRKCRRKRRTVSMARRRYTCHVLEL